MFDVPAIEYLGYLASILVVISLTMTNIVQLRIYNTIGCLLFTIYGIIVGAYPVAIANSAIIVINLYNLAVLKKQNQNKYNTKRR